MTEKKRVGRPKSIPRKIVKTTHNVDADLYETIERIAQYTGIPKTRVINMMIRAMFESNANIKFF
jgi:hypothetical protein